MNKLIVGRDKSGLVTAPGHFLLIDDGSIIDRLDLPTRRKVIEFDVTKHSFNPVRGIDYARARDFVSILDAVFPEGDSTLTKKGSNFVLLKALLERPKSLDKMLGPNPKDGAHTDAYQKLETLLLSPVLRSVLCKATNFPFTGTILARLDRAALGDFDCFVMANLLIGQYKGQVIVPDFGFYAAPHHASLIRQERLMAGVNFLDEVSVAMRQRLLMIEDKAGRSCTVDDAKVLAGYTGLTPATNAYVDFIQDCIS